MTPRKTGPFFYPAMIFIVLAILSVTGCAPKEPPLSQRAVAFKMEVGKVLRNMQQSLAGPAAKHNIPAIDAVLQSFAQSTAGMCVDCPYRSAVLNAKGDLLTTFPKQPLIANNFSSYKMVSEPLQKQRISQRQIFQADGTKIYYISVPLMQDKQVVGVVVLGLTPADLEKKWQIIEKDFLAIDFNAP